MNMTKILEISNSWPLWALCGILVTWVVVQAGLYVRLCRKEADHIGYPQKKLNTAIVNGMVTAIGPGLAGVVVMISMMAVIGGPITWQPQGGLLRQPDRSVRPAVQPPSCHRIGPAGGRGAGPAAGFFCDAAGKTKKEIAPFSLAPSGRGLRPQAVGERALRSSEIFRAMARLSPSAPSGHLPPRGRQASGQ